MSHLLTCSDLAKSFGPRPLFEGLSLSLREGERVGLIGPNGAGKTTFLRILAGIEDSDSGKLICRRGLRVSYLPQSESFTERRTIGEILFEFTSESLDEATRHGMVGAIINLVELPSEETLVGKLSGGFKKRLAIASRLLEEPELLLLDEPTNHLDLESIEWLESLLKSASFATVVISHDRAFLDSVAERIVEVNRRYPEGFVSVDGNYSRFLLQREEVLERLERERQSLANSVRREVEWLRRQPKARTTKSSARIEQAQGMIDELQARTSRARLGTQAEVDFSSTGRQTKELLVAKKIAKSFQERRVFSGLELSLFKGSKLGIVGRNGSGKSTLLKILSGEIPPDEGSLWVAPKLRIVTFDQQRAALRKELSLRRYLAPEGDSVFFDGRMIHVASYASRYLFSGEQLDTPVGSLSGGEQARLLIAKLILEPADLLLLDEPTNDLDIETVEALEESLQNFPGAVVLISHDRELMRQVATQYLVLAPEGHQFVSSYDQWQALLAKPTLSNKQDGTRPKEKRVNSKELQKVQRAIEKKEQEISVTEQSLAQEIERGGDIVELCRSLGTQKEELERLYERWQEIEVG